MSEIEQTTFKEQVSEVLEALQAEVRDFWVEANIEASRKNLLTWPEILEQCLDTIVYAHNQAINQAKTTAYEQGNRAAVEGSALVRSEWTEKIKTTAAIETLIWVKDTLNRPDGMSEEWKQA